MAFDDVWMNLNEAAKKLGLGPEDIELMITGMNSVADRRDGGKLVNLKGIGDYLQKIQAINNKLISPVASPSKEEKSSSRKEPIWIKGRVAAQTMSMKYESFLDLCEKGTIKAKRKARGWRIEESVLNEFIKFNQELIASLKKVRKKRTLKIIAPDPPSPNSSLIKKEEKPATPEKKDSVVETPNKDSKDDKSQEDSSSREVKCFTVKARKQNGGYYCQISDIARSLHLPESTVKKWITDKMVSSIEKVEPSGVVWYIEHEGLRTFLEKYNILLTFDKN